MASLSRGLTQCMTAPGPKHSQTLASGGEVEALRLHFHQQYQTGLPLMLPEQVVGVGSEF